MKKLNTLYLIGLSLFLTSLSLSAQEIWLRDSVYFDKGVPQTTDFENLQRTYFVSYDNDGRPLEIITHKPNLSGVWTNWRRRIFTYTGDMLGQLVIQYWSASNQTWEDAVERNFTYDADENPATKLVRRAPGAGMDLENFRQWTYGYDATGNQLSTLFQAWENDAWQDVSRQTWAYNGQGLVEQQLLELWIGAGWINFRNRNWQYEGTTGLLSSVTSQVWSIPDAAWENELRQDYLNDGVALWTGIRRQSWNEIDEAWENLTQETFNYGPANQLEDRIVQEWEMGDWQNMVRLYYTFNGETLNAFADKWNPLQSEWEIYARHQTQYAENNRPLLEQGWQFWEDGQSIWENDTLTFRRQHFWSEQAVAAEAVNLPNACLVPNPYTLNTPFVCERLSAEKTYRYTLTDLTGRSLLTTQLPGGSTQTLNGNIPAGLYVLQILDGTQVLHVQKLVIIP